MGGGRYSESLGCIGSPGDKPRGGIYLKEEKIE
ncbi:hypothetical protein Bhyg_06201, partial [Pseudolycoriella hygida]